MPEETHHMTTQLEEKRTPKSGRLSLHPVTFERALRGLLETKLPEKRDVSKFYVAPMPREFSIR